MIIGTKELYEIGWYVFKLFALYKIISTLCAIAYEYLRFRLKKENKRNESKADAHQESIKNRIEPIESNYKCTRMGFTIDTTCDDKEP